MAESFGRAWLAAMAARGQPEVYEVEEIRGRRVRKGRLEYLVVWKGYPASEATWEPEQSLEGTGADHGSFVPPAHGGAPRDEPDEGEYEVEVIRDRRVRKGTVEFLVLWKGFPADDSTWEPQPHLKHAQEHIDRFLRTTSKPGSKAKTIDKMPARCSVAQNGGAQAEHPVSTDSAAAQPGARPGLRKRAKQKEPASSGTEQPLHRASKRVRRPVERHPGMIDPLYKPSPRVHTTAKASLKGGGAGTSQLKVTQECAPRPTSGGDDVGTGKEESMDVDNSEGSTSQMQNEECGKSKRNSSNGKNGGARTGTGICTGQEDSSQKDKQRGKVRGSKQEKQEQQRDSGDENDNRDETDDDVIEIDANIRSRPRPLTKTERAARLRGNRVLKPEEKAQLAVLRADSYLGRLAKLGPPRTTPPPAVTSEGNGRGRNVEEFQKTTRARLPLHLPAQEATHPRSCAAFARAEQSASASGGETHGVSTLRNVHWNEHDATVFVQALLDDNRDPTTARKRQVLQVQRQQQQQQQQHQQHQHQQHQQHHHHQHQQHHHHQHQHQQHHHHQHHQHHHYQQQQHHQQQHQHQCQHQQPQQIQQMRQVHQMQTQAMTPQPTAHPFTPNEIIGCGDCGARITAPETCFQLRCPFCGIINEATSSPAHFAPPVAPQVAPPSGATSQMAGSSKQADVIDLCDSDNDGDHVKDTSNRSARPTPAQLPESNGLLRCDQTQIAPAVGPQRQRRPDLTSAAPDLAQSSRLVAKSDRQCTANSSLSPKNEEAVQHAGAGTAKASFAAAAPRSTAASAKQRANDAKARAARAFAARLQGR